MAHVEREKKGGIRQRGYSKRRKVKKSTYLPSEGNEETWVVAWTTSVGEAAVQPISKGASLALVSST